MLDTALAQICSPAATVPCCEAFVSIVDGMVDQYAKFLKTSGEVAWREPVASLNYLLTSEGRRQVHDGNSHQGPGFIHPLLTKKQDITRRAEVRTAGAMGRQLLNRTERSFAVSKITESVTLDFPVRTVYNQWTQFEEFPRFMEGVERVDQLDDKRLHWVADFGGERHEWDAEITDQVPDQRVAWRATDGKTNAGVITFRDVGDARTEVSVEMDWEPQGLKEKVGGALGFDDRRVKGDLKRLEDLLAERGGRESGAWRGEQH